MKTLDHSNESIFELLIKQLKGHSSEEDLQLIRNWLNEGAENKRFYDELNDIWMAIPPKDHVKFDTFEALKRVKLHIGEKKEKFDTVICAAKSISPALRFLKIAAVFVLAFGLGIFFYSLISRNSILKENLLTVVIAPIGSKSRVMLPDGTNVYLNSGSKLCYDTRFNLNSREVTLEGEAYFDVTKKNGKQFLVKTKDITVRVLGTAFNVKAYSNEGSIETTLVRGSLIVEQHAEGKPLYKTMLEPNQRATFIRDDGTLYLSEMEKQLLERHKADKTGEFNGQIVVSKKVDTEIFTAWKENRLVFRNETFESLTVKLERWYGVQINIADEEIKKYHFNGTIVNETIQDVMEIIKFTLPINYSIQHNVITIQKNKYKSVHPIF